MISKLYSLLPLKKLSPYITINNLLKILQLMKTTLTCIVTNRPILWYFTINSFITLTENTLSTIGIHYRSISFMQAFVHPAVRRSCWRRSAQLHKGGGVVSRGHEKNITDQSSKLVFLHTLTMPQPPQPICSSSLFCIYCICNFSFIIFCIWNLEHRLTNTHFTLSTYNFTTNRL